MINPDREPELLRLAGQTRTQVTDLEGSGTGMKYRAGYLTSLVHHLCDVIEQVADDHGEKGLSLVPTTRLPQFPTAFGG